MSTLQGNAKKYDGTRIDYVLIFNWLDGEIIGTAVPNAAGVWTFNYYADMVVGITYVADGCEPITHGAYSFAAEGSITGYLILKYSHIDFYNPANDVLAIDEPTWGEYFSDTKDIALLDYRHGAAPVTAPLESKVIDVFDVNWVLSLWGFNNASANDDHLMTFEILDVDNNVLFALKSQKDNSLSCGLWYGNSLSSLSKTPQVGSNPYSTGELSFTADGVFYKNVRTSRYNASFSFVVNLSSAAKIRVAGSAKATGAQYTSALAYLRILPAKPVQ